MAVRGKSLCLVHCKNTYLILTLSTDSYTEEKLVFSWPGGNVLVSTVKYNTVNRSFLVDKLLLNLQGKSNIFGYYKMKIL